MKPVEIDGIPVGPGCPPYIIAEIGSNHNGDMDLCRRLIDSAAACGAHAVQVSIMDRQVAHCRRGVCAQHFLLR